MPKQSEVQARIVRAAAALFSRQGYHGTSTREIARLADVSEVTVFRYFVHKEDIFCLALSSCFSNIRARLDLLERVPSQEQPEVVLSQILSLFVDTATFSPELIRLVAVAFLELRGRAQEICREHLAPLLTKIAGYLAANIESGRVRNLNPAIMTAAMALTVIAQPELSMLIDGCQLSKLNNRQSIDEYKKFWLSALMPLPRERTQALQALETE
jgi:AcrR family transcriptional regulator